MYQTDITTSSDSATRGKTSEEPEMATSITRITHRIEATKKLIADIPANLKEVGKSCPELHQLQLRLAAQEESLVKAKQRTVKHEERMRRVVNHPGTKKKLRNKVRLAQRTQRHIANSQRNAEYRAQKATNIQNAMAQARAGQKARAEKLEQITKDGKRADAIAIQAANWNKRTAMKEKIQQKAAADALAAAKAEAETKQLIDNFDQARVVSKKITKPPRDPSYEKSKK